MCSVKATYDLLQNIKAAKQRDLWISDLAFVQDALGGGGGRRSACGT